jgi:hemerythrin superfamily protein
MTSVLAKLSPTITNMIRMDHTHVTAVFHQYEVETAPSTKKALVTNICLALEVHAQLEEEIFYPAMQALSVDLGVVEKSVPEHDEMRRLIAALRGMEPTDAQYDVTVMELMRDVLHHVADEETTLLPDAERLMKDRLRELGAQMTRRRLQLLAPRASELAVSTVRSLPASTMVMSAGAAAAGLLVLRRLMARR